MLSTLNNRELATYIWLGLIFIVLLCVREVRKGFPAIFKALFVWKILLMSFFMFVYIALLILLFYKTTLWDKSLLKDTIVWIITVGFVMLLNANKAAEKEYYLRDIIKDNIKLVIVVEFLINFYVFHLAIELILFPILAFLVMIQTFGKGKKQYEPATKLADNLLSVVGLLIAGFVTYNFIHNFKTLATYDNLKSFLMPMVLTIMYIPFIYFLALLMVYEEFYQRLSWAYKNNESLHKYAKRKVFKTAFLSLSKMRRMEKELKIFIIESPQDLDNAIKKLKLDK